MDRDVLISGTVFRLELSSSQRESRDDGKTMVNTTRSLCFNTYGDVLRLGITTTTQMTTEISAHMCKLSTLSIKGISIIYWNEHFTCWSDSLESVPMLRSEATDPIGMICTTLLSFFWSSSCPPEANYDRAGGTRITFGLEIFRRARNRIIRLYMRPSRLMLQPQWSFNTSVLPSGYSFRASKPSQSTSMGLLVTIFHRHYVRATPFLILNF